MSSPALLSPMNAVRVYVTSYCPYCTMAKRHLDSIGVRYEVVDVTTDAPARSWLVETTGMRTVPQIFVGATPVGGYTDMMAAERDGTFRALLDREGIAHH
jgi:glutaredoxin 3